MLSCREVVSLVASDELASAGWRRRLAVRLHWLMCRYCRRYAVQLRAIAEATRKLLTGGEADPSRLDRLEGRILDGFPAEPPTDKGVNGAGNESPS